MGGTKYILGTNHALALRMLRVEREVWTLWFPTKSNLYG